MSDEVKPSTDAKVDKKTFKRQVDQFVKHHRHKQNELLQKNKRRNLSLEDIIQRSSVLQDDAVEVQFDNGQNEIPDEVTSEVHGALKSMQSKINVLDPRKRFFILETINFFNSKIGLNKLIPALITLNGKDQKRAVSEFIFPTFFSIQKNIETLVACDEIFDSKTVHIERSGLYILLSDISRIIIRLFKDEFVSQISGEDTTLAFLSTAVNPVSFKFNKKFKGKSEFVYQEMIDDEDRIREIVLEFIVAIQSHESLYNYAKKRSDYYKGFLLKLTRVNRFQDIDPIDISKILAGCFVANEQLQPPDALIAKMVDKAAFNASDTLEMQKQFIDKLSPSVIFRLLGRFRVSLQHISKVNFGNEFQDIQRFSVKTILKNVWEGFIELVEKALNITTGPFLYAFNQVRKAYEGFVEEEQKRDESIKSSLFESATTTVEQPAIFSKNLDAFSQMTQSFKLVKTSVISLRGEHEGATYKDFGYNFRFFRNNEGLMVQFLSVYRLLFQTLASDKNVIEITYENQRQVREYYAAYKFDIYLLCIGLTHIRNPKLPMIEEKSIFPYIILFKEEGKIKEGNAASRTIVQGGVTKAYNELRFTGKTAKIYYEALYLILHLLPGEAWEKQFSQACINYLVKELNRMLRNKEELLYCEEIL
ncbi:MAG: hypothetical protein HN945_10050 [Deltaproteobacteria bacterium]|nr:hypothetical protein [Deltaproteobacteria bacterium]MBT4268788.1 hypothetical protein [Deltaproteobacteria bacterium]MBT4641929.1 hypothetical protein [Deltaproteobacteria bacterium]MBT6615619.1 hypothetical protein [Deltaproteobacteria bacterium]MBT7152781.1 hypothetical protein [Deltaproteobacteria bacterium]